MVCLLIDIGGWVCAFVFVEKDSVVFRCVPVLFISELLQFQQAFIRLDAWFQWFNTTQSGKEENTYFWHGRDNTTIRELNPKSLSSGFDDYPCASHPSEYERHLDLRCWIHLAADCMHYISKFLEDRDAGKEYGWTAKLLLDFELLNQKCN